MSLLSLKIAGFKSFADPTTLEFAPGVTGIVGPNGSGKSNITEAVRWAMGEQSAKGLRGERMSDVIFAGTQLRPALNLAEVTLQFDNRDAKLKLNQQDISVTRKIFRNGDSEFYINKKACRLKDITNLFLDSGLGKASFSIISQGKVEAVFNSRPEDRRTIIEETAGVHQYKLQKTVAISKLDQTDDNLDRVADIIHEIEGRLEPLHQQSSLAKEFIQQKKQYDVAYETWLVLNIQQKDQAKQAAAGKLSELNATLTHLTTTRQSVTEHLTQDKTDATKLAKALDQAQQDLVVQTQHLEALKGQLSVASQKKDQVQSQIARQTQDLKVARTNLTDLLKAGQKRQAEQADIASQSKALQAQMTELKQVSGQSKASVAQQLQQANDDYLDRLQQGAEVRNEIGMQQKSLTTLEHRIQRLTEQQQAKSAQTKQLRAKLQQLTDSAQLHDDQQKSLQQQSEELISQKNHLQQTYDQQRQEWLRASEIFQKAQAKLSSLQELQANFSGFYQGPKAILKQADHLEGVVGAVANLLTVPQDYQLGIETILGGQLQNIVVQNEATASRCIQFLRQNHQGRATFLPLTSIKTYQIPANVKQQLQKMSGFLGIASELIQIAPEYQKVAQHLLGTVLVAQDLKQGVAIARAINRRYRIVTLQGDILSTSGAMSGGTAGKRNGSLLAQQQEIQTAQVKIGQMQQALQQKQADLSTAQATLEACTKKQAQLTQQRSEQSSAVSQAQNELMKLQNDTDYAKRELTTIEYDLTASSRQKEDLTADLKTAHSKQGQVNDQLTALKSEQARLKAVLADYDASSAKVEAQLNQLKVSEAALTERLKNAKQLTETNASAQHEAHEKIAALQDALAAAKTQTSGQGQSVATLKTSIATEEADLEALHQTIATDQKQRDTLSEQIEIQQNQLNRQIELVENAKSEVTGCKQRYSLLSDQIEDHLGELSSQYHETFEAAFAKLAPSFSDVDLKALNQQLKLLKRGLDEIGTVNLDAIDEYSQTKTRYDFLTQQKNDLISAKETLMATISELDQEVSSRFAQTFADVSTAFTEIFPKMFGGGQARLDLTDPEDMLQTGIEIKAQPPGKKLQSMSLLSGGERALTAITLLFAIIQVRPVPFCILDEVEASLDDANVDRYAEFLRAYDAQTQFIVITHRKGTMMRANRLYGVTMEESGVSKIVAVSLTEQLHQV